MWAQLANHLSQALIDCIQRDYSYYRRLPESHRDRFICGVKEAFDLVIDEWCDGQSPMMQSIAHKKIFVLNELQGDAIHERFIDLDYQAEDLPWWLADERRENIRCAHQDRVVSVRQQAQSMIEKIRKILARDDSLPGLAAFWRKRMAVQSELIKKASIALQDSYLLLRALEETYDQAMDVRRERLHHYMDWMRSMAGHGDLITHCYGSLMAGLDAHRINPDASEANIDEEQKHQDLKRALAAYRIPLDAVYNDVLSEGPALHFKRGESTNLFDAVSTSVGMGVRLT